TRDTVSAAPDLSQKRANIATDHAAAPVEAWLAHRLEERRHVAVEDVLVDERLLGERRDPLADGLLVGRELDLVVDADRDGVGLVASRDGRGFLRNHLLRVRWVLHLSVVPLVLELVQA